jgi:hypothetical protein
MLLKLLAMYRILFVVAATASMFPAEYKAGVARVRITPEAPIWMSGYASRNHPSEGVSQDLWAKALAIEDGKRNRVVIVTTDLIGLPRAVGDEIAARCAKEHGLDRAHLILNSSHTHTGPVIGSMLVTMWDLPADQTRAIQQYTRTLVDKIVQAVGSAVQDLSPAEVALGTGEVGFAMNRREFTPKGVRLGVNPSGPVDHTVPVLRITATDGRLRVVLFGYACHNTTFNGDMYKISGDYAGFAEATVETQHPGATAMFLMLCGGDQNPQPRGTEALAEQHGHELAAAVEDVLKENLAKVSGTIRAAFFTTELPLAPYTRDDFEAMKNDRAPQRRRLAEATLKAFDERRAIHTVAYPAQAIRFGKVVTLVALGGEVVVPYALELKREYPREQLIVAGYSNDVMCYIPTARMLKEGGYEPVDSMVYYGFPAPFASEVEDRVLDAARMVLKRVGWAHRGKPQ